MYVGRKHTATVTTKNVLAFDCVHCHQRAGAMVIGVGQGSGNSPFMLDESGAKTRAETSAETNSRENAEQTLVLARCPNCHRRNERAVTWRTVKTILASVGSFLFLLGLGLGLDALKNTDSGVWICTPLAIFLAGFVYSIENAKWSNVDGRVTFLEDEAVGLKKC